MTERVRPVGALGRTGVCHCSPDCNAKVKDPTRKYARGHNPNSHSLTTEIQSNGGKSLTKKGKEFLTNRGTKGGIATLIAYGREYYRSLPRRKNLG